MENFKTIHLLRHAKSDWEAVFLKDQDRPLSERGKKNAKELRNFLKERKIRIDLAYVSEALRTVETLNIINKDKDIFKEVNITPMLYEANFSVFKDLILNTGENIKSVLLLGHNPDLEELANQLLLRQNAVKEFSFFSKFPTCAFISFSCSVNSWKEFFNEPAKLSLFWVPVKP